MNKRDRAILFRENLTDAMSKIRLSRTHLAERAHIDRSTLGQLLSETSTRLPNGHTIAAMAEVLGVSSDWLLGLSHEARPLTTFLDGAMNFAEAMERAPIDSNLEQWYREAGDSKIRHVPTTLPDVFKTHAVLDYEYKDFTIKTGAQAVAERDARQHFVRLPDTEMDICIPIQRLEQFAQGQHIWAGLEAPIRTEQIQYMANLIDELYPRVRVYGFDLKALYSVPSTVFGNKRAAIYIGQGYFVLNTTHHVRSMARHFDSLVRQATVHAHDMAKTIRDFGAHL